MLAQKIEVEQVLQDVWTETKVPLLIYATETALAAARTPLPIPLQRFAQAENEVFQGELKQETAEAAGDSRKIVGPPVDPISPSKRKHRADSIDSMDSNRASLGSEDGQLEYNNRFEDGRASTATITGFMDPLTEASPEVGHGMAGQ